MTEPRRGSRIPRIWLAATVILLLALGSIVEALTATNLIVSILFVAAVALASCVGSLRFLWLIAGASVTLCLLFHLGSAPQPDLQWISLINRILLSGSLLVIASLAHLWILSERAVRRQSEELERQNASLEAGNRELGQREEEIVRQNEELQSQSEELERQSEELRVANEELEARERMLEQLLQLSRTLTAELSRDEVLKKVCDALSLLSESPAGFWEKRGEDLVLVCHAGFTTEEGGPQRIPYSRSFASLVMTMGHTGYLEDARQRPDMTLARVAHGDPFLSVLGAPLRVQGRFAGTVEIYSTSPRTWGEGEVILVESLAAQASTSLQNVELVETILQERRRFESSFRTMPFGMLAAEDPRGERVRVNPAAAAFLNIPQDEDLGVESPLWSKLRRYFFQEGRTLPEEAFPLARALHGEEVAPTELDVLFPTGRSASILMSASPIYGPRGEVAGAVAGFADISPQKNLLREIELRRREAEEASLRKTRFLAAVSHDLRTPANAVNLLAELIRRSTESPALAAQAPEMAQKLQDNIGAMMELVGDLLDIARFDTGQVSVQESEFGLAELLDGECRHLLPLAEQKGIALVHEPADRPVWLRTDRVKLGRILGNVIGNAIKFTERGRVTVSSHLQPDVDHRVIIRIQDTGVGIPPEELPRIFDEFIQLRNPERDRSKGTGLGLAICKRLVHLLGGAIDVRSRPGEGSVFEVSLPASCLIPRESRREPATEAPLAQHPPLDLQVLLVEDHSPSRDAVRRILLQEGAIVTEAPDARSALEHLRSGHFQAVLLDMMLPDLDGREVLKAIQAQRPPGLESVLVLTADLTADRVEEIRRLGGDHLIAKPVDVRKLVETLRSIRRA